MEQIGFQGSQPHLNYSPSYILLRAHDHVARKRSIPLIERLATCKMITDIIVDLSKHKELQRCYLTYRGLTK